ncbi:hypothetical protein P7K49_001947, partial [Saguinus oedipus]
GSYGEDEAVSVSDGSCGEDETLNVSDGSYGEDEAVSVNDGSCGEDEVVSVSAQPSAPSPSEDGASPQPPTFPLLSATSASQTGPGPDLTRGLRTGILFSGKLVMDDQAHRSQTHCCHLPGYLLALVAPMPS